MNLVASKRKSAIESRRKAAVTGLYASKIIKAGALIADTQTLLSTWDVRLTVNENLGKTQVENIFGKASRSRVQSVLAIFRQRYLMEESVTRALVALVRGKLPTPALKQIFYFHSARSDRLLHDIVTEVLYQRRSRGLTDIGVFDLDRVLANWVAEGKTKGQWSPSTISRISQGLLSTLRDFGILEGAVNKRIAPFFLPIEAFAYVAFYLKQHQPSGAKLLELPDWKLFFLTSDGVERSLFEAHQRDLLDYHVAGSVTRLTFPAATLDEYANVLVKK